MADQFSARFNLSHSEFLLFKDDFNSFQEKRAEMLKKELPHEVAVLKNKRVLFVGDSITSDNLGFRASVSLAANLCAFNGSVSSATSSTLFDSTIKLIEDTRPEIVSIMIGTNDSIILKESGLNMVSIDVYSDNMKRIIAKAKEIGAKILLFSIPYVEEKLFASYFTQRGKLQRNENVMLYNSRLHQIAKEEKIKIFNHTWLDTDNLSQFLEPDGVHLNVAAQELFSKAWLTNASNLKGD